VNGPGCSVSLAEICDLHRIAICHSQTIFGKYGKWLRNRGIFFVEFRVNRVRKCRGSPMFCRYAW
jgi:hypothetical protein